jgi:hypothetical protein
VRFSLRRILIVVGLVVSVLALALAAQVLFAPRVAMEDPLTSATALEASAADDSPTPQSNPAVELPSTPVPGGDETPDGRRGLQFAGYTWHVREARDLQGPGPNYFSDSPDGVWLDDAGSLHLRVAPGDDGRWYGVEIISSTSLGYGTYQFTVDSRLDDLDPNVVLGMFTWSDDPAENHRELDIEFAHFGKPTAPIGRYTVQPYTVYSNVFLFAQPDTMASTHSFHWDPSGVTFQSWSDASGGPAGNTTSFAQHVFDGPPPTPGDERVHLNLWLDAGKAPVDGQPVEIVVRNFAFTPLD